MPNQKAKNPYYEMFPDHHLNTSFRYARGSYERSVDEAIGKLIEEVLDLVPKEARDFVCKNISFIGPIDRPTCQLDRIYQEDDSSEGEGFSGMIFLEATLPYLPVDYQKYYIAHEIAHLYLDHDDPEVTGEITEKEADEFAAEHQCPKPKLVPSAYDDILYEDVKKFTVERKSISAAAIQKRFRVGYTRAALLLELLEEEGVIGSADGATPREVLGKGCGSE